MTLDRLYAACLAGAGACDRRRTLILWLGGPAYVLLLVAVGSYVLQRFPNSGDEYVYLYEAATFAEGRLANPAPARREFFEFNYIAHDRNRVFGTFPPGWPVALAAAHAIGIPAWLLNPLIGTLTLVILWALGRALYGPRVAMLSVAVTAVSPFFVFNAASFFSHTFCGALLLLAAYLAAQVNRARVLYPILVGFLIGWAVLARYFTGVIGGAAVSAVLVRSITSRRLASLGLVALGGVPWLAFLLAYNQALSGSMWHLTTTPLTMSLWFARGFASRGLDILATQLLQFLVWTPPALLVAYLWYLRRGTAARRSRPLDWLFVANAVLLIFYVNRGGNQYGPRFYYEAFLFLVPFTTASLFRAEALDQADRATRGIFAAMAASIVAVPLLLAVHAWHVRTIVEERTEVFTRVAAGEVSNAVVLVHGRIGTARSMDARDLTRNGIDYARSVLFALDRGRTENCRLAAAFENRRFYVYTWDRLRRSGTFSPLRCP